MKRLINEKPGRPVGVALTLLPFLILLLVYMAVSAVRLADNPADKLLPSVLTMGESIQRLATEPNRRTGELILWVDTAASLGRLAIGVTISMAMGLVIGMITGLIPYVRRTLSPLVAVLSMIPPLAILPILFIAFGVGELAKVALIVFGIAPFIMRDVQQRVEELPAEQLIKAQTLGGSTWQILLRVVLPQVFPRLLDATRLALGSAWLFLIAAEAIAATEGLGYRIFLVRRYLDMEIILPYVAWITLLAFLIDLGLRCVNRTFFPWYGGRRDA
ncbi:MAG: ABC transporter permease subunit [Aquisalimonadaceae bacterium]